MADDDKKQPQQQPESQEIPLSEERIKIHTPAPTGAPRTEAVISAPPDEGDEPPVISRKED